MTFESIDVIQRTLADTVFQYATDRKKAAGRALGTLVEIVTFYTLIRDWLRLNGIPMARIVREVLRFETGSANASRLIPNMVVRCLHSYLLPRTLATGNNMCSVPPLRLRFSMTLGCGSSSMAKTVAKVLQCLAQWSTGALAMSASKRFSSASGLWSTFVTCMGSPLEWEN